jgi:hypothetical protein
MKRKMVLVFLFLVLLMTGCTYAPKHVPCDAFELVDAINKSNSAGGIHTLELAQGCVYELTWIEDMTNGHNGLPTILTEMTINGNGATIIRADDAPNFRIFHVGSKTKLTLNNLTIENGHADGAGPSDYEDNGGAILNRGILTIDSVLITNSYAGFVGGIFNTGTAIIKNSTISHNNADQLTNGILNGGTGVMEISHSTISENGLITYGDAIWNIGTLNVYNSTISDNQGVGIESDEDSIGPGLVSLEYVTFSGNSAALNAVSGNITIRNTLIGPQQQVACGSGIQLTAVGVNMDTDGSCNITTVSPNSLKLGPLANNGGSTQTNALGQGSVAIDAATGDCPINDQRGVHRPQSSACDVGAYEYDGPFVKQEPEQKICKFTSLTNLFCRLGPGMSVYPEIDSFTPGQESEVLGISPDGFFVQVVGAANELPCYVPVEEQFGELIGDCDDLPTLDPPPTPEEPADPPDDGEPEDTPVEGCTVIQTDGSLKCVSPCPAGIGPGDPCTMP